VEAGCQGTLRVRVDMAGRRAHTARPFTGRNAIHRIADVISRVAHYEPRTVVLDGVEYEDQLQVVFVEGGVAANVVPDARRSRSTIASPRSYARRGGGVAAFYLDDLMESEDEFTVVDWAPSAQPMLTNERLEALVALTRSSGARQVGLDGRRDVPRTGDSRDQLWRGGPLLAHRSDEKITRDELELFERVLRAWLS
jgi:succinyl-diaminopimelate desuccinylase